LYLRRSYQSWVKSNPERRRTFDEARADFASADRDLGRMVAHEGALPHPQRRSEAIKTAAIRFKLPRQNHRTRVMDSKVRVNRSIMNTKGAVFQPELIELMKAVLDDAAMTASRGEAHFGDEKLKSRLIFSLVPQRASETRLC